VGRSRSLIFIPGNNSRFLGKSKTINSDIICFDLEDSVPIDEKETARILVNKTVQEINKTEEESKNKAFTHYLNNNDSEKTALKQEIKKEKDTKKRTKR